MAQDAVCYLIASDFKGISVQPKRKRAVVGCSIRPYAPDAKPFACPLHTLAYRIWERRMDCKEVISNVILCRSL